MNASIVSATGKKIPAILDDQAQILGASVRLAKYAPSASSEITKNTIKALKNRMAALMSNHGAVCIGRDLEEAFVACQILEKTSKAFIDSQILGGAKTIKKQEAKRLHKDYLKNYSKQMTNNNIHCYSYLLYFISYFTLKPSIISGIAGHTAVFSRAISSKV